MQSSESLREARLSGFFDQAAAGMSETDLTGRFLRVNDRFCEITGRSREELLQLRMQEITHPDDLEGNIPLFRASIGQGGGFEIEKRYVRPDGAPIWVHNSVTAVRDATGEVVNTVCVTIDISSRKAAEEQLRRSQDTFYNLIQNNPFGVYVVDADFKVAEVSQGSQRVFENVRPLIGRDFGEVLRIVWAEPFASEAIAHFRHTLETGEPYASPRTVERRGDLGAVEAYDWRIERIELPDGRYGVVCYFYDLSERQRWESALTESEARLRALTDNLPAGMVYQITTGKDGSERKFLYISQSHEKLTGVPAEAVLANPAVAYELILPEYRERLVQAERQAIEEQGVFDQEVQFRRADGEVRWCRIISEPREQADGKLIWDGIQIDITDQKLAEQRLRELNSTLEERVAARAAELAQAQEALRQSQKLESMGQLTGGVAHDFNNLLTPIIGGLDMLQRRRIGDERAQRTIEGALASADRAKTLVQRLLAFARRQPLQRRAVDISELVASMAALLESTLGPRISLTLTLPERLPLADADPNQLEMALLNLALNARDAMPDGGALMIAAGHRTGAEGDMLEVSVADTGHGMSEEIRLRAVEPFFSTKGVGQGTGLGLSMVHGLAAQLGGELVIESERGRGTIVRLQLPVASQDDSEEAREAGRQPTISVGTALLVDDEDLVRESTAEMLSDMGFEVVQESSAEAALGRLQEGLRPSIIITDHLMPGMTGTELAHAARAIHPDVPALVISGYADVEGIAGVLPRLTKPFRHAELHASIAKLQ